MTDSGNRVKCSDCGWVHVAIDEQGARQQVDAVNKYLRCRGELESAALDDYLHCFRCGADTSKFVQANEGDAPPLATIQAVVVQR